MMSSAGHGVADGRREELAGDGEITPKRSPAKRSRFHNFSFPTMNWSRKPILPFVNPTNDALVSALPMSRTEEKEQANDSSTAAEEAPMALSWNPRKRRSAPLENGRNKRHSSSGKSVMPRSHFTKPSADPDTEMEPRGETNRTGGDKKKESEQVNASTAAEAAEPKALPWNLRKRRATCQAPLEDGKNHCPSLSNIKPLGSSRRSVVVGQRKKFSISLSRAEIEQDYLVFKGRKPNKRPKKRPRFIQNALDELFPGAWLSEIKANMYKVHK